MSRTILVPVEGISSLAIVERALRLAAAEGARVRILGLEGPWPAGMVRASAPDGSILRHRRAIARLRAEARSRAAALGVDLRVVSRVGPPREAILEEIGRSGVDLVVADEQMPWLSRSARRRGADRLRREAPCSVILIGTGDALAAGDEYVRPAA